MGETKEDLDKKLDLNDYKNIFLADKIGILKEKK